METSAALSLLEAVAATNLIHCIFTQVLIKILYSILLLMGGTFVLMMVHESIQEGRGTLMEVHFLTNDNYLKSNYYRYLK